MDFAALFPAGLNFISSLIQGAEERKRRKKAVQALERIMLEQRRDFAGASASLREGQEAYKTNPDRLNLLKRYKDRSEGDGPFGRDYQSLLQNMSMDQAGQQQALGMSALRERLQGQGLTGSGVAAGAQVAYQQTATNNALGRTNAIGLEARKANEEERRRSLDDYQALVEGGAQNDYTFGKDYANLLSSKQYGNSGLFAAAYG
mgnify:CR=1 FL=1